jgi:hypothetical protein
MRTLIRRAWTLHEMLISLAVMGLVTGLAAHAAVAQLRFFQGVGEVTAVRAQVTEVGTIAAAVLWGVSPADGEILAATDSAIEVSAPFAAAVVCVGGTGSLTVAAPVPTGNTLASADNVPEAGDVARLFIADSNGAGWIHVSMASSASAGGPCPGFPAVGRTWQLQLREPIVVPAGAVLRWTRRIRLSLYRASDARWYLGVRDWNVASQRLNTIQPVAGPLLSYSVDGTRSGLRFRYAGLDGGELTSPIEFARVASISVTALADAKRPVRMPGLASDSGRYRDSVAVTIALRNAR